MKFFKMKIAILILALYILPWIIGIFYNKETNYKIINVYDHINKKIIEMDIDDYLIGVVSAEMPASFDEEALKAQAIVARTYLTNKKSCDKHPLANICTDYAHCQAYKNKEQLKKQWGNDYKKNLSKIKKAVSLTKNYIITYENQPISAVFHSTSSGKTENSEDVWSEKLPYLRSVDSSYDKLSPKYKSQVCVEIEDFKKLMKEKFDVNFGNELIGEKCITEGGSVRLIKIGNKLIEGTDVRNAFGLKSACFETEIIGNKIIFIVYGYGHGVGMSQYGADFMAKDGYDCFDIIKKYYTNVEIKQMQ